MWWYAEITFHYILLPHLRNTSSNTWKVHFWKLKNTIHKKIACVGRLAPKLTSCQTSTDSTTLQQHPHITSIIFHHYLRNIKDIWKLCTLKQCTFREKSSHSMCSAPIVIQPDRDIFRWKVCSSSENNKSTQCVDSNIYHVSYHMDPNQRNFIEKDLNGNILKLRIRNIKTSQSNGRHICFIQIIAHTGHM